MMMPHHPRRTVGHHFGELLTCPQQAWLHYYGNYSERVQPPSYMITLQREGLDYEKEIYKSLYPNARKINGSHHTRAEETFQAMKDGEEAILQGYIATEEGEGIIDVLEKIGPDPHSITGFSYRVGEIKRSETLKTAHVLQTAWYTDLLAQVYHQNSNEMFFILGNHQKQTVRTDEVWEDYERVKKILFQTRDNPNPPGPFFTSLCSTCAWRGVCMKELIEQEHISLVPGISRIQAASLREAGAASWRDLDKVTDTVFISAGFHEFEIEHIRLAVRQLGQGILPLRKLLRNNLLSNVRVAVVDFPVLGIQPRKDEPIHATSIIYESSSGVVTLPVQYQDDRPVADISSFLGNDVFVFYGNTSLVTCQRILHQNGGKFKKRPIDLLALVEQYLHGPLVSLDLEKIYDQVSGASMDHRLRGEERVRAVRSVIHWLEKSLV